MLEGVSEVFKHFQGSRLASVALLAATGFLIFASRYVTWGPTVPDGWLWLVWAIMVFTAIQCAWWSVAGVSGVLKRGAVSLFKAMFPVRIQHLSKDEKFLLGYAAANSGNLFLDRLQNQLERNGMVDGPEPIAAQVAAANLVKYEFLSCGMMGYFLTDSV